MGRDSCATFRSTALFVFRWELRAEFFSWSAGLVFCFTASTQIGSDKGAACEHHKQSHEIRTLEMEAQAMNETHTACRTGPSHGKASTLRPRRATLKHPLLPRPSPRLKAKIENDAVFEDGDEQHDAEPGQHAQVLQEKVSQLAALVVLAVPVEHFWQLGRRKATGWVQTDFVTLALQMKRSHNHFGSEGAPCQLTISTRAT